jgi:hypothetical protein
LPDPGANAHDEGMRRVLLVRPRVLLLPLLVAACLALLLPPGSIADDGDDERREVRREATCTGSSEARLRLRAEDGEIEVRFEIAARGARSTWRIVLLHERRTVFRGVLRKRSGKLELRRVVDDWFGEDEFVVRAAGPRAEACRVSAVV